MTISLDQFPELEALARQGDFSEALAWITSRNTSMDESEWVATLLACASFMAERDHHGEALQVIDAALGHYPGNVSLHVRKSAILEVQGRSLEAVQSLRRAIREAQDGKAHADHQLADLWLQLARVSFLFAPLEARTAVETAGDLVAGLTPSPELDEAAIQSLRFRFKLVFGSIAGESKQYAKAQQLFEEILQEDPEHVAALSALGHQHMLLGKIDEAVALFDRVTRIDPEAGLGSLVKAKQIPDDPKYLVQLEEVARRPAMEGSVRRSLLFGIAAAWEKAKEYDKAFSIVHEANEASKKRITYSPKDHRQYCARLRRAFSKGLFEHRKECGYRGEDASLPVFVVGMPRSGTTLVEQIIASHSQIYGAGELSIIPARISAMNRWEHHTGSGRIFPECIDDLNAEVSYGIARGVLGQLRKLKDENKPGARHVVDKLPHNFQNVGLIKFLFPEARIISVRRDPRDIAVSNYFINYRSDTGLMGFAYDLAWIGEHLADHNLLMRHWEELFAGQILEVQYEELVDDTPAMARRMLDYIGVAWEPEVLRFNELQRPVKTASVWQVRQPIYKTSKAKWRRYEDHLSPLIKGTNARITWDPIDAVVLPEPGLFVDGVSLYREGRLDEAGATFTRLLHFIPDHAAGNYMLGLVHVHAGRLKEAISRIASATTANPWNRQWRRELIDLCRAAGEIGKAGRLEEEESFWCDVAGQARKSCRTN